MPDFTVHGPYPVKPATTKKGNETFIVDPVHAPKSVDHLDKYGCYVFVRSWGKTLTPWYVGKTMNSLKNEMFTPHKLDKFSELQELYERGGLSVFLIVPVGKLGAPAKNCVDKIESHYIREAYVRNPKLLNMQKIPRRDWELLHVTKPLKRRSTSAVQFRKMLGA
jgi:hypothetical protein